VTVAICSRNRPESLRRSLASVCDLDYGSLDVLVVLNAPSDVSEQERLQREFPHFRIFVEPRPGLDNARNTAIRHAHGEFICYTDDDTEVHSQWVARIVDCFRSNPDAGCVTGLIAPAALDHEPEAIFENIGGFGRGYLSQTYRVNKSDESRDWFHLGAGEFGAGANMSFRLHAIRNVGHFDPNLDVGTPSMGGGDLEMFIRILESDYDLVYEPSVIVFHHHRQTISDLYRQLATWGVAFNAMLMCVFWTQPRLRAKIIRFYLRWILPTQVGIAARDLINERECPRGWALQFLFASVVGFTRYPRPSNRMSRTASPRFNPVAAMAVRHLDVASIHSIDDVTSYSRTRIYLHDCGSIVADVMIENCGRRIPLAELAARVAAVLPEPSLFNLRRRNTRRISSSQTEQAWSTTASIIVATAERPSQLNKCLKALSAQRSRHRFELIVVNNVPKCRETATIVRSFPSARYVEEPRRGLSAARNAGIRMATGEIIVMTDDDVVAPEHWLDNLLEPFERSDVGAVTGLTVPAELDTVAQLWFECYGGLGRGYAYSEHDKSMLWCSAYRPSRVWDLGATANAAVRREVFEDERVGLMTTTLGPGTPAHGGEDIYLFHKILKSGRTHVYQPSAWLSHVHRRTVDGLASTLYRYSCGHGCYLWTLLLRELDLRVVYRFLVELPLWHILRLVGLRTTTYPRRFILWEIFGLAASPFAYALACFVDWRKGKNETACLVLRSKRGGK
jgi:GT2 family glycosyltransferase